MADKEKPRSQRGFASMDPAKQRSIASKGGHAAHQKGTAHEFTPEEARAAGRIGGEHSRRTPRPDPARGSANGDSADERGGASEDHPEGSQPGHGDQ
ncbi:MAG TPA: KGG domain-containing protein [Candidatus Binataceae bacterium]|jgi:general stress protein YciG|nr:KGG domain-containing protein [Candidatus Binataceae bacterium]